VPPGVSTFCKTVSARKAVPGVEFQAPALLLLFLFPALAQGIVIILPIKERPGRSYLDVLQFTLSSMIKILAAFYFAKYLL
jgi:hypothetical protein